MNVNEEQELKKEFQLERIILFSDAVFAIIVTIMVIELKMPEGIREASRETFIHEFRKIAVQLVGYGLSFFFVAMFWTRHVKLFGFLKDYNKSLLIYNLIFLFCVSLFPFAVSMMTGFNKPESIQAHWGFNIYVVVIFLCMFVFTLLSGYLIRNKETLCYNQGTIETQMKWRVLRANYWVVPLIMVVLAIMNYINLQIQNFAYIMAFYGIIVSRIQKKYYPKTATDDKPFIVRMFAGRQKKSRRENLPAGD
jgi:uncharacterized membrane protein